MKTIIPTVIACCIFIRRKLFTHPKVAGAEFRTSGGTYAAVPTNVHALSSVLCREDKNYFTEHSELCDKSMQYLFFSY
jgi:hypothetical protein